MNHWQVWLQSLHGVLLDTPEKAVRFGEAVVAARYGQAEVDEERPFVAEDVGDAWKVTGTHPGSHATPVIAVMSIVTLRKTSGEIIDFTHQMPFPGGEAARQSVMKADGSRK